MIVLVFVLILVLLLYSLRCAMQTLTVCNLASLELLVNEVILIKVQPVHQNALDVLLFCTLYKVFTQRLFLTGKATVFWEKRSQCHDLHIPF